MGYTYPVQPFQGSLSANDGKLENRTWSGVAKHLVGCNLDLLEEGVKRMRGKDWHIALCDLDLPRTMLWRVAWRSGIRALPLKVSREWSFPIPRPVFDDTRTSLATLPSSSEFERVFVRSLPQNFLTLYLKR